MRPDSSDCWLWMVVRPTQHLRLMPEDALAPAAPELVESYQRLADVFHEVLAEQSLDALLVRIADALARPDPARHAHDLRGGRGAGSPDRRVRPRPVRGSDHGDAGRLRPGHHRLGRAPARGRAREPGPPRPARALRPGDADRSRGAHRDPADLARAHQGRAEHLPDRRGRPLHRRRIRPRAGASPMRPHSHSTTRRFARASSIRRRRTP